MNNPQTIFLIALHPQNFPFIGESHGICAISGFLKEHFGDTLETYLYDQQLNDNDTIINDIIESKPDIIGISVKMFTFEGFVQLYTLLSENVFPIYHPIIVIGNSVAHFSGEYILKKREYNDVIVSLGEGEVSWGDLIRYSRGEIQLNKVRNIIYYSNGCCVKTKYEYLNKALIPIADRRHSKKYFDRGGEVYIEASRGCNYCGCSICECRDFLGSRVRRFCWRDKPIEKVIKELQYLQSIGIDSVTFSDEDFFGDNIYGIKRAYNLARQILRHSIKVSFRVNARVKTIYDEKESSENGLSRQKLFRTLKEAGLVKIFLGFESGSHTQLARYSKGFKLEEFLEAKSILDSCGIQYELGYISIDPLMTPAELMETLTFIQKYNCIQHISSIYKKLRVQKGNYLYVKRVKAFEQETGRKIIGDFLFNEQVYKFCGYANQQIENICIVMDEYENEIYKLYYRFRILTQYDENSGGKKRIAAMVNNMMCNLKEIDYNLLYELAAISDLDINTAKKLKERYAQKRKDKIMQFVDNIKSIDTSESEYLLRLMQQGV